MGNLYNVFYGHFDLVCQLLIGDVGFLTVYDIKSISILAVFQHGALRELIHGTELFCDQVSVVQWLGHIIFRFCRTDA